jgi:hypothetical protein
MTIKARENRFIETCKNNFGPLTFEAELLLRWGFLQGAQEVGNVAYLEGMDEQRTKVLDALGAARRKETFAP